MTGESLALLISRKNWLIWSTYGNLRVTLGDPDVRVTEVTRRLPKSPGFCFEMQHNCCNCVVEFKMCAIENNSAG